MKAFISYSLVDTEQIIVSLLSNKLREKGYYLETGRNLYGGNLDYTTSQQIASSQLFIGIISLNGGQTQRVLKEWHYSLANKVPAVLLIEQGVPVSGVEASKYVRFDRHNPSPAIDEINKRMLEKKGNMEEVAGWILAGAAILGVISLFTEELPAPRKKAKKRRY